MAVETVDPRVAAARVRAQPNDVAAGGGHDGLSVLGQHSVGEVGVGGHDAVRFGRSPHREGLVGEAQEAVGLPVGHPVPPLELLERWLPGQPRIEDAEDRQRQELGQRIPLSRRSDDARPDASAEEEVQVDDELDVTVVGPILDERGRQNEDVVAAHPFAEEIPGGLGRASEL